MRLLHAFVLILMLSCLPATAGQTAWQEVAPGVSIRLISDGMVDASGRTMVALEIDMPENTKTYWRVPGETGLPTELDFTGSHGIAGHQELWPFPSRDESQGYLDYVYFGHTILPISLDVSDPAGRVELAATLGICSEICVPAQARLELPLADGRRDTANALRIQQALAEVPVAWKDGREPAGPVLLAEGATAISVEIDPAVIDARSLIVAGDLDDPLFGAPQKSPQGNLVLLPIMGKTDNSVLDGMEVDLSFMTSMGAFEISRTIEAGTDATVTTPGQ